MEEAYLEISILASAALLNCIQVLFVKQAEPNNKYLLFFLNIAVATLSVVSNQLPWCLLLYFAFLYRRLSIILQGILIYLCIQESVCLFFPGVVERFILYVPSSCNAGVVVVFALSTLLFFTYSPSLPNYQKVILQINDYTITALGYYDSGNGVLVQGKALIFLKQHVALEKLFRTGQEENIMTIGGMTTCKYVSAKLIRRKYKTMDVYVAMLPLNEEYDCILNLYC